MRRWREAGTAVVVLLVASLALAADLPRLTFAQLVDSIRANNQVTEAMRALNGKEVEIQGFIIPAGPPDLSFFLLSRVSALGNYCCEMPTGQDETVYVSTARGTDRARTARSFRSARRPRKAEIGSSSRSRMPRVAARARDRIAASRCSLSASSGRTRSS